MDFSNLNERLDLDNTMKDIVNSYTKNEDDFIFYIRGKISTGELFFASASESNNFGFALFSIACQNELIKKELLFAVEALKHLNKLYS